MAMRRCFVWMALTTALAAVLRAESVGAQSTGWALDRYEPAPAGDRFFAVEHPVYARRVGFAVGLTLEHAFAPLVFRETGVNGAVNDQRVVAGMLVGHLGASLSFVGRVGVGVSFPVSFLQSGSAWSSGGVTVAPADSVAPGDLRVTARVRLFGRAEHNGFSLHLGAALWAPTGDATANTSDGGVRVEPRLTAAGRAGPLRWSAMVGFTLRPTVRVGNAAIGSELRASVGLAAALFDDHLLVGPEAWIVTRVGDDTTGASALFADALWGGEALLGARYRFGDALSVGVGGGVGLARGIGIPAGRAMFNVAWAPPEGPETPDPRTLDSDSDGVHDSDDVCDTTPQGTLPDPAHPGCPQSDSDGDNVGDATDACPREPQGARPDPTRAGCPQRDRDSDGVFDADDACPEAAMGPRPDRARRGCPLGDRDGDGVSDPDDLCPDTPQGSRPDPVRRGCVFEVADSDSDLVPDADDACPQQPGVASTERSIHGCPNAQVELAAGILRTRRPVVFNPRRPNVRRVSRGQIEAVADVLRAAPSLRRISVDVHGDGSGRPERAQELSERRAALIMRTLIQLGVPAERLEAHGLGNQRTVASAETVDGRARNERVEFRLVDVGPAASAPAPATPTVTTAPSPAGRHGGRRRGGRGHHR